MDTHSRDPESPLLGLSPRQRGWGRAVAIAVIAVAGGGLMYALDPSDLSWLGCWVFVAMLSAFTHLPRDYQLHRVVKAWLGLLLVIFTGGLVILALEIGLSPYWAALYAAMLGMTVERLRLFDFEARDLWAGKPKDETPVEEPSDIPQQRESVS